MAEKPRYIHTLDDMDEYGELISSSTTDGRHPLDPSMPVMTVDDHLQRFSNDYAQIRQKYNKPTDEISPKLKGDISHEIDTAVCKAMERLIISSPHLNTATHSLGLPVGLTPGLPKIGTNETLLDDAIKTVDLLTGCVTSPVPAQNISVNPLV